MGILNWYSKHHKRTWLLAYCALAAYLTITSNNSPDNAVRLGGLGIVFVITYAIVSKCESIFIKRYK